MTFLSSKRNFWIFCYHFILKILHALQQMWKKCEIFIIRFGIKFTLGLKLFKLFSSVALMSLWREILSLSFWGIKKKITLRHCYIKKYSTDCLWNYISIKKTKFRVQETAIHCFILILFFLITKRMLSW